MNYGHFLGRVIDDGIEAAKRDYAHKPRHLAGALRGFEECRGLLPDDIGELLREANMRQADAGYNRAKDYWFWSCRGAEIWWVANVISAAHQSMGKPTIITPTARGMLKAMEILGVRGMAA